MKGLSKREKKIVNIAFMLGLSHGSNWGTELIHTLDFNSVYERVVKDVKTAMREEKGKK